MIHPNAIVGFGAFDDFSSASHIATLDSLLAGSWNSMNDLVFHCGGFCGGDKTTDGLAGY